MERVRVKVYGVKIGIALKSITSSSLNSVWRLVVTGLVAPGLTSESPSADMAASGRHTEKARNRKMVSEKW